MKNSPINNVTDYDTDAMLGFVIWHSIADVRITEADVQALAIKHGLGSYPKLGCKANAFRRATATQQQRGEKSSVRYLMRPVKTEDSEIIREVVVEIAKSDKSLSHRGAVQIIFDQHTESIRTIDIAPASMRQAHKDRAMRIAEEASLKFDEFSKSLTGKELTRFAMGMLDDLSYVNLRPNGGVYFVPRKRAKAIASLMGFFNDLRSFKVSSAPMIFGSAPVPNDPQQVSQVAQGVDMTLGSEIDQMTARIMECDPSSMRESSLAKKSTEVRTIREKAREYAALLDHENNLLEARLDVLDQAVSALADRFAEAQAEIAV